ncbi:MAG: right-handed parallel beta-helix repeat-containing protein [Armatimonadetes bacterium]|nr:right-handed parallel beta-helix repeat-containing protein [Armatimonadota bacterium]
MASLALALPALAAGGPTASPGPPLSVPVREAAPDGPKVFAYTREAGPDQTFFVSGENLSGEVAVWGAGAGAGGGREWKPKVLFNDGRYLAATLPEECYDGPMVAWVKGEKGYSRPFVLNAPQVWWITPDTAGPGETVDIFGANLSRRPDFDRAHVCARNRKTGAGLWLPVIGNGKYRLRAFLPSDLPAGDYTLWLHTGAGGDWGGSGPARLRVRARPAPACRIALKESTEAALRAAIESARKAGGGVVALPAGEIELTGTLKVGTGVVLEGPEPGVSVLRCANREESRFAPVKLDGQTQAAIWLAGSGSGLRRILIQGSPAVNAGVLIRHEKYPRWIEDCRVESVAVTGVEGKQAYRPGAMFTSAFAENRAVYLSYAKGAVVRGCHLWARAPVFMAGARQCVISGNRLVCQSRYDGNAEGAILGRYNIMEECVVEDNIIAAPEGMTAGGPTVRRMAWIATGHGSVSHNWIARNRVDRARFGGVAGGEENVGEMILFEACERIAFFGPIESAGSDTITLPETLPPTPDSRLGGVKRDSLAHDAQGRETPFWPPDASEDDGTGEPPVNQYYVTVLSGAGAGQTRRVLGRVGRTYRLESPWREPPAPGSRVVVCTLYYQNLVVDNEIPDGMTGVQLWIGCVENIVSGNHISRQRRPGLYLYATCTTLASSQPVTWNAGIGPANFNLFEGNRTEECSDGALIGSGDSPAIPIEFPRAMGNVLRYNSFIRNRGSGVNIGSRARREGDTTPSIVGSIVELNLSRDAMIGYHVGPSADHLALRRNFAYFWYPVSLSPDPPIGFQFDQPGTYAVEGNNVEDKTGSEAPASGIVSEKHVYRER